MNREKLVQYFIIGTFVSLYIIVSVISTIHVIDFFKLSNPEWLAVSLAIAFEIGAAASLASLITLDKMNKALIWALFIILTLMQMMGNAYYAYVHLENYQAWIELFGLVEEEPITQKRILAIISGAILPVVALGFVKSLVDYIKPSKTKPEQAPKEAAIENLTFNLVPEPIQSEPTIPEVNQSDDEEESEMSEEEYREYINYYLNEQTKDNTETNIEKPTKNSGIAVQDIVVTQVPAVVASELENPIQLNAEIFIDENKVEEKITEINDQSQRTEDELKTNLGGMNPQVRPGVN